MKKLPDLFTCEKTFSKMENSKLRNRGIFAVCILLLVFCFFSIGKAQSIDQSFPTPITANQITGKIPARDLGDPRLTSYYYIFNANQGDVFINVKTTNLDGDIDFFTSVDLRPLTKITVFSDASNNETGRVIYLRKPEKLILRVQGRTPNDEAATFSLKFAGSFVPELSVATDKDQPEMPEVKTENQTDVRVNSVGTIIEVIQKPAPKVKENNVAKNEPKKTKSTKEIKESEKKEAASAEESKNNEKEISKNNTERRKPGAPSKPKVIITEGVSEKKEEATNTKKIAVKTAPKTGKKAKSKKESSSPKKTAQPENSAKENALENVRLLILFKDGTKLERSMNEVLRVGVDKGILTLITKDGAVLRYSILDVARMAIE